LIPAEDIFPLTGAGPAVGCPDKHMKLDFSTHRSPDIPWYNAIFYDEIMDRWNHERRIYQDKCSAGTLEVISATRKYAAALKHTFMNVPVAECR
jgi:hypothetical protein